MSTNLNYKQVANVTRRTWDVETYEKRAKDRTQNDNEDGSSSSKKKKSKSLRAASGTSNPEEEGPPVVAGLKDESTKEEFMPAVKGAAGPHMSKRAFLKARQNKVDVDSKIGSVEVVNPDSVATTKSVVGDAKNGVTKTGVGWHCKVCDCFLRDSHMYLDHINGKKHQRNLGYSMRVERSTKDQVASRLALLAKEKEIGSSKSKMLTTEEDFHDMVRAKDEEERKRREERAQKRKERKKKLKDDQTPPPPPPPPSLEEEEDPGNDGQEVQEEEEEVEEEEINPDLAAMMGFSGFGGR